MSALTSFIFYALFALSGFTSLVYESLWVRWLSLGVGSTSLALSVVLSIFFLGLAGGSALASRYLKKGSLVLNYGALEAGIGAYALAIAPALRAFPNILSALPLTGSFSVLGVIAKFFLVFVLLLLPTLAMGASFPLLTEFLVMRTPGLRGRILARLYGVNTFGAVSGAFATSFLMIPRLGLSRSNLLAACMNFLIFGVSLLLAKRSGATPDREPQQATRAAPTSTVPRAHGMTLGTCALLGFSSIATEVVWNKYLGIFFGTNIFGLGLVLALFLFGIALGSTLWSLYEHRVANKRVCYVRLLLAAILSSWVATALLNFAPVLAALVGSVAPAFLSPLAVKAAVVALIIALPTSFFGALFPLSIQLLSADAPATGRAAGMAYSVNTVGSIFGSALAGVWLVPQWGSATTLRLTQVLLGAATLLLIFRLLNSGRERRTYLLATLGVLALCLGLRGLEFQNIIKSAYHQSDRASGGTFREILKSWSQNKEEFIMLSEGETAITSLSHDPADGPRYQQYLRLKTNGLNESVYDTQNLESLPKYEALLGFLPYLFVRDPKTAFVVGYGGGSTTDYLTRTDLQKVYVAELEKGILQAADYIHNHNNPILKRANLNLEIEDARYVLAAKLHGPYDIIVSQPSHSWLSGVANLFTQDFFKVVRKNLTQRGVFSQWLNLYNIDEAVLKSILHTFYSEFPYGAVFTDVGDSQMIMIGSMHPLTLNWQKLNLMAQNGILQRQLVYVPFTSPGDILGTFSVGRSDVMRACAEAPLNTDDNAYAETHQSALFYAQQNSGTEAEQFFRNHYSGSFDDILPTNILPNVQAEILYSTLQAAQRGHKQEKLAQLLDIYLKFPGTQLNSTRLAELGAALVEAGRYASGADFLKRALQEGHATSGTLNQLLQAYSALAEPAKIVQTARTFAHLADPATDCYLAEALMESHAAEAQAYFEKKILRQATFYQESCGVFYHKMLGNYYFARHEYAQAARSYELYQAQYDRDIQVIRKLLASSAQVPGLEHRSLELTEHLNALSAEAAAR